PLRSELQRFPPTSYYDFYYDFSCAYEGWLKSQDGLCARREVDIAARLEYVHWADQCWAKLRYARDLTISEELRRDRLSTLEFLLGREMWALGKMPEPVPAWWMERCD